MLYRDFCSDVNLAFEIMSRDDIGDNYLILMAGVGSIAFTLIPYLANLIMATRIKEMNKSNATAKAWFQENTAIFAILVAVTGGCHAALALVSSNVFGLNIFSCGLTQYELKQMGKLKVIGTVIIENIPQLICQALYSMGLGGEITAAILLAFVASALSIIASTLAFLIERDTSDTKVVQYYLFTECSLRAQRLASITNDEDDMGTLATKNRKGEIIDALEAVSSRAKMSYSSQNTLTDQEKENFINNRGRTAALGEQVAELMETHAKNIEIGHSMITKYGIITHVVHSVAVSDLEMMKEELVEENQRDMVNVTPIFFVSQLYASLSNEINHVFRNHFELNDDFEVEFHKLGFRKRTMQNYDEQDEDNDKETAPSDQRRATLVKNMASQISRSSLRLSAVPSAQKRVDLKSRLNEYFDSKGIKDEGEKIGIFKSIIGDKENVLLSVSEGNDNVTLDGVDEAHDFNQNEHVDQLQTTPDSDNNELEIEMGVLDEQFRD